MICDTDGIFYLLWQIFKFLNFPSLQQMNQQLKINQMYLHQLLISKNPNDVENEYSQNRVLHPKVNPMSNVLNICYLQYQLDSLHVKKPDNSYYKQYLEVFSIEQNII